MRARVADPSSGSRIFAQAPSFLRNPRLLSVALLAPADLVLPHVRPAAVDTVTDGRLPLSTISACACGMPSIVAVCAVVCAGLWSPWLWWTDHAGCGGGWGTQCRQW